MSDSHEAALRASLATGHRWVVKIGSALATNEGLGLNRRAIDQWARQVVELSGGGKDIVLVASGSVAEGAARLDWRERPHALNQLQAAAAVGQMGLVGAWDLAFEKFSRRAAQVLLTHEDLSNRERYLNARSTLLTLLQLQVIPVVNENDTVATDEIKLGDNDTLAGLVANLMDADLMVILTDQAGLMSADPRHNPSAELITHITPNDHRLDELAGPGGSWGRGGMRTKIVAARLAARSATSTIIASGHEPDVLLAIAAGREVGTLVAAPREKQAARKRWLAGFLRCRGRLVLDAGACRAICDQGKSLLPVGVTAVDGHFERGELVALVNAAGQEVARGLTNYAAAEASAIVGATTRQIESRLGYAREPELVHRDNLALV